MEIVLHQLPDGTDGTHLICMHVVLVAIPSLNDEFRRVTSRGFVESSTPCDSLSCIRTIWYHMDLACIPKRSMERLFTSVPRKAFIHAFQVFGTREHGEVRETRLDMSGTPSWTSSPA